MIEKLHKLSQGQISKFIKEKFLNASFFKAFPELKTKVSVLLIGSVGYDLYDDMSDIDVSIVFPAALHAKYKDKIKEFKTELKKHDRQVQLFYNTTLEELRALTNWQDDLKIREFSNAVLLHDPKKQFTKIQKQIRWYPVDVYKEKINWLFAEAVFELADRYNTAAKRGAIFYCSVSKLNFLQLTMTAVLLLNKQYPIYEKHLYRLQGKQKLTPRSYSRLLRNIISEQDLGKAQKYMTELLKSTEQLLLKKSLIPNQNELAWIDARSTYTVKLK